MNTKQKISSFLGCPVECLLIFVVLVLVGTMGSSVRAQDLSVSIQEDESEDMGLGGEEEEVPFLDARPVPQIQWYFPISRPSPKKNRIRVIVSGRVEGPAKVHLGADRIPVIIGRRAANAPPRALLDTQLPLETDRSGTFEIVMDAPQSNIQLPLRIVTLDEQKEGTFQLNLVIRRDRVELRGQDNLVHAPAHQKRFEAWFGTGFNYLRYSQDTEFWNPAFETFTGPSFFAKGRARVWRDFSALLEVKMSPGATQSSESLDVTQGSYQWWIYSGEVLYMPASLQGRLLRNPGPWGIRVGAQHHIMPFLRREEDVRFSIVDAQVTMATLGFQHEEELFNNIDFEIFMRYQHPITKGDVFTISPIFAFDGSLGLIYNFRSGLRLGAFWYGQWHEYNYTDKRFDPSPDVNGFVQGRQSLFFSNAEIRLGYAFD